LPGEEPLDLFYFEILSMDNEVDFMSNLRKTLGCSLLFFVFLALTALICRPSPLCAATIYQLNAKAQTEGVHQGGPPAFSLRYYDADGDNLFSLDELIIGTFTGVTWVPYHFTVITGVPINGWFSPLTDGPPRYPDAQGSWSFFEPGVTGMTWFGDYWTYSQTIVYSGEIRKIEQWKLILNGGLGSGNLTVIEAQDGTVTSDGDWTYTYQGANASGPFSNASATIAGASISATASGIATHPYAPSSPFTLNITGKACNGHGSGTFTITFAYGSPWPSSISGTWKGTRTFGRGITPVALPCIPLLMLDD
jgi:hypothetical protein